MKINGYAHYTQCFMYNPCERSRDQLHVAYPDNTNGYRWGFCRECDLGCICNRLVDMRNEGFENGLAAAREAVAEQKLVPLARQRRFIITRNTKLWDQRQAWSELGWWDFRDSALAAIDALKETNVNT